MVRAAGWPWMGEGVLGTAWMGAARVDPVEAVGVGQAALPQRSAGESGARTARGLALAGTGCEDNQCASALTSALLSWPAMWAMQSGAMAWRWRVCQAPSWALR